MEDIIGVEGDTRSLDYSSLIASMRGTFDLALPDICMVCAF